MENIEPTSLPQDSKEQELEASLETLNGQEATLLSEIESLNLKKIELLQSMISDYKEKCRINDSIIKSMETSISQLTTAVNLLVKMMPPELNSLELQVPVLRLLLSESGNEDAEEIIDDFIMGILYARSLSGKS